MKMEQKIKPTIRNLRNNTGVRIRKLSIKESFKCPVLKTIPFYTMLTLFDLSCITLENTHSVCGIIIRTNSKLTLQRNPIPCAFAKKMIVKKFNLLFI